MSGFVLILIFGTVVTVGWLILLVTGPAPDQPDAPDFGSGDPFVTARESTFGWDRATR